MRAGRLLLHRVNEHRRLFVSGDHAAPLERPQQIMSPDLQVLEVGQVSPEQQEPVAQDAPPRVAWKATADHSGPAGSTSSSQMRWMNFLKLRTTRP